MSHDDVQLDDSCSLYFLGQTSDSVPFRRYAALLKKCQQEGDFLSFESTTDWLACYEGDAQSLYSKLPLLVFRPFTTSNIAPFLRICHEMEIPVTARCGGTGVSGGCVSSQGGVVVLTGHLKAIKSYDGNTGKVTIEPGVTARQLNRYVAEDGWHFPLSLATEGSAGLGGCLSCHARGYHQQQYSIYEGIEQVILIDGKGERLEVPSSLACGSEGLWGVIIEMHVQLKKRASQVQCFCYSGAWKEVLVQFSSLQLLQILTGVIWCKDRFHFTLEGDAWRLPHAIIHLARCLPGIEQVTLPMERVSHTFLPSRRHFVAVSSLFATDQLPEALTYAMQQAHALQLECLQMVDLLSGSLHLILQADGDLYAFRQAVEHYLVLWANYVEGQQGVLASTHGIGMQMRHYMTPFWTEESQQVWFNLQALFDPKHLFGREHFFPVSGKSLERVRR